MEKKTMGGFIAALRKVNGMTQKDLAERLNVSDKTISRWECDEGTPDLSLIPVIAEIFNVTCDELLTGGRRTAEPGEENRGNADLQAKGEKQRRRLYRVAMARFNERTMLAAGLGVGGLVAALFCNFGFCRATIGFYVGMLFYTVGIVVQAMNISKALLGVEDSELEERKLCEFRNKVICKSEMLFGLIALIGGFSIPLFLTEQGYGFDSEAFFGAGFVWACKMVALYAVVCFAVNVVLRRKGILAGSPKSTDLMNGKRIGKGFLIKYVRVWLFFVAVIVFFAFDPKAVSLTYKGYWYGEYYRSDYFPNAVAFSLFALGLTLVIGFIEYCYRRLKLAKEKTL